MNALRNSVRLIGHIGEDPKVKKFEGGKTVANFSIATNEIYRDSKGEKQSETTWHWPRWRFFSSRPAGMRTRTSFTSPRTGA